MVTMPVPTLISLLFWYWASRPPESAVSAPEMHRPTVMVKAGLMLEALTIAALSPVARMDKPSRVRRAIGGGAGRKRSVSMQLYKM